MDIALCECGCVLMQPCLFFGYLGKEKRNTYYDGKGNNKDLPVRNEDDTRRDEEQEADGVAHRTHHVKHVIVLHVQPDVTVSACDNHEDNH